MKFAYYRLVVLKSSGINLSRKQRGEDSHTCYKHDDMLFKFYDTQRKI